MLMTLSTAAHSRVSIFFLTTKRVIEVQNAEPAIYTSTEWSVWPADPHLKCFTKGIADIWHSLCTSVFVIYTFNHCCYNTVILTFCDWFWQVGMRPCGWNIPTVLLLHLSLSAQSSVQWVCVLLFFMVKSLLQSFSVFYASKKCFIKNSSMLLRFLFIFSTNIWQVLGTKRRFTWKYFVTITMALSVPVNHRHQDYRIPVGWTPNFMHFLYGPGQISIKSVFPGLYAIFRWSPQKCKIGVLLYLQICLIPSLKSCVSLMMQQQLYHS
jgi:hypothetical protein